MSVAPDRPENLPAHRLPPHLGGWGKDPVWALDLDLLGADLQLRQDSANHGLIEPAHSMSLDDLQRLLESTKDHWEKVP